MTSIITTLSLQDRSLLLRGPATQTQLHRAEELAFQFWENYQPGQSISGYCMLCESQEPMMPSLLVEGFIKRNLGNFLQMALAWAVKIGGKVGLAAGIPLGEIGEMAVDAFFAAEAVVSSMLAIKDVVVGGADKVKDLFKKLASISLSDGAGAIYAQAQEIITEFIDSFSLQEGDGDEVVEDILISFTDSVALIIDKASQVIGDGIAVVIPIPGADILVAEGLIALGDKAFDIVSWVFDKIPDTLKKLFTEDGLITGFLNGIIDSCVEFLEAKQEEDEKKKEEGVVGFLTGFMPHNIVKAGLGKIADILKVADKMIEFLTSTGRKAAKLMGDLFSKIVPFLFSCLASFQIISQGDYGEVEEEEEVNEMKITLHDLRTIIKEYHEIHADTLSHNSS